MWTFFYLHLRLFFLLLRPIVSILKASINRYPRFSSLLLLLLLSSSLVQCGLKNIQEVQQRREDIQEISDYAYLEWDSKMQSLRPVSWEEAGLIKPVKP